MLPKRIVLFIIVALMCSACGTQQPTPLAPTTQPANSQAVPPAGLSGALPGQPAPPAATSTETAHPHTKWPFIMVKVQIPAGMEKMETAPGLTAKLALIKPLDDGTENYSIVSLEISRNTTPNGDEINVLISKNPAADKRPIMLLTEGPFQIYSDKASVYVDTDGYVYYNKAEVAWLPEYVYFPTEAGVWTLTPDNGAPYKVKVTFIPGVKLFMRLYQTIDGQETEINSIGIAPDVMDGTSFFSKASDPEHGVPDELVNKVIIGHGSLAHNQYTVIQHARDWTLHFPPEPVPAEDLATPAN